MDNPEDDWQVSILNTWRDPLATYRFTYAVFTITGLRAQEGCASGNDD